MERQLRYRYSIEAPTNDPYGDPYKYVKELFSRESAQKECPIDGDRYCHVSLEERVVEFDDLGSYVRWEALSSAVLELEELHSSKSIDEFLIPVSC